MTFLEAFKLNYPDYEVVTAIDGATIHHPLNHPDTRYAYLLDEAGCVTYVETGAGWVCRSDLAIDRSVH